MIVAVSFRSDIQPRGGRNGDRRPLRLGALLRRARLPGQIKRADDQTDVTIGLRKIAQHAAGQRIKLFGGKPTSLQRESKRSNNFRASA